MADVFVSYARLDLALAQPFKERLEGLGLSVFFDIEGGIEAGDSFPVRIGDAVTQAKSVLALWTPHALTREWCRRECHLAQQLGKLVPVILAPVTAADLKEFVATSYEDLTKYTGSEQHFGWSQTLSAIARRMDAWAEANSQHVDASGTIERASKVRKAAIAARPPSESVAVTGLTGAAAVWEKLKDSHDPDDLIRFAETFPGTVEALEGRRIADRLRKETQAWANADKQSIASVQEVLSRFPDHFRRGEIRLQLQELEAAARLAEEEARRKKAENERQAAVDAAKRAEWERQKAIEQAEREKKEAEENARRAAEQTERDRVAAEKKAKDEALKKEADLRSYQREEIIGRILGTAALALFAWIAFMVLRNEGLWLSGEEPERLTFLRLNTLGNENPWSGIAGWIYTWLLQPALWCLYVFIEGWGQEGSFWLMAAIAGCSLGIAGAWLNDYGLSDSQGWQGAIFSALFFPPFMLGLLVRFGREPIQFLAQLLSFAY